jgi:cytochrome c556
VAAAQNAAPQADAVADFMRAKLGHSQHVLEGLALEDYDLIARGAQELALASQASSWQVLQTEEYARQSAEFRRSCDALRTAAKQKNLDGAALAWMEVTMKCVQCHKYVRDQK